MASMACLKVGSLFSSYEELKAEIDRYQRENSVSLSIKDSRTIEGARRRLPNRVFNKALKYYELRFVCVHHNLRNCEMGIRVVATKDGESLQISKLNENHNHPLNGRNLPVKSIVPVYDENDVPSMISPYSPVTPYPTEPGEVVEVQLDSSGKRRQSKGENQCSEVDYLETDHKEISYRSRSPERKRTRVSVEPVSLGKQTERWRTLKNDLELYSDEELAELLLNNLEQNLKFITSNGNRSRHPLVPDKESSTECTPVHVGINVDDLERVHDHVHASSVIDSRSFDSNNTERRYIILSHDGGQHEINATINKPVIVSPTPLQSEMESAVATQCLPKQFDPSSHTERRKMEPLHDHSNKICQENQCIEILNNTIPLTNLGKQYERWTKLKETLQIETDEEMAKFLMDHR